MITSRRIVNAKYASTAFDGEGARITGGRWNSPGVGVVYTSESVALALLESLVRLRRTTILSNFVIFACIFDEALVDTLATRELPRDWRAYPAPSTLQEIGDEWVRSGRSAVLRVPSVLADGEHNFLLNPLHADFGRIQISPPQKFVFDLRLLP